MTELTSKSDVAPAANVEFSAQGVDPDCRAGDSPVAFRGFMNVEKIADVQFGGTCWAEAIQKAIQLVKGDKTGELNNLSSEIIARVISDPGKWGAVENPTAEESGDVNALRSDKGDLLHHGFGLGSIRSIVDDHDGTLSLAWADHRFRLEAGLANTEKADFA